MKRDQNWLPLVGWWDHGASRYDVCSRKFHVGNGLVKQILIWALCRGLRPLRLACNLSDALGLGEGHNAWRRNITMPLRCWSRSQSRCSMTLPDVFVNRWRRVSGSPGVVKRGSSYTLRRVFEQSGEIEMLWATLIENRKYEALSSIKFHPFEDDAQSQTVQGYQQEEGVLTYCHSKCGWTIPNTSFGGFSFFLGWEYFSLLRGFSGLIFLALGWIYIHWDNARQQNGRRKRGLRKAARKYSKIIDESKNASPVRVPG